MSDFRDASITGGAAGADVAGVTIHAGDLTVQASVSNGRYVAWWPGPAFEREPDQPNGDGGPRLIVTYDLTLTDSLLSAIAPCLNCEAIQHMPLEILKS